MEKLYPTKKNKKILVAGNGGSCADAEHFVGELQCTFKDKSRDPVSAFALGNLAPAITAWSNDFEFLTFLRDKCKHMDSKMIFFS